MKIHEDGRVLRFGAEQRHAEIAMIMLHGRDASAADIAGLAEWLPRHQCAFVAPEAAGNAWFPRRFLEPRSVNEPHLSSALKTVDNLVVELEDAAIPTERILLLGFSQGACLCAEYVARRPRRFGGLLALAGGLIGEQIDPAEFAGALEGTPVFLGCSEQDPFIPRERVELTSEVLQQLGADVSMRLYPGTTHAVNDDEIVQVRSVMASAVRESA